MEYILSNTLLALLETPGTTLLGVNRMLADKDYRKMIVDNIKDPSVKSFWVDEFAKYTDRFAAEATPAIQNKIGQFTSNPLIRNIIGQSKSSFDLRKMMDENKIIIINLSKGRVGEANANLLGSMFITKIYLAAMSRADVSEKELQKLPNFYLYVDEFQSFANESFADILSEARKYKLNLTIAHQYIEQMSEEVRAAVFGNVGTMITFRVGAFDAEILEKEFAPQFTAEDLVNLGFTQIYLKLMIDGVSSSPFSASTMPPIKEPEVSFKKEVIDMSRLQFAMKRADVEQDVLDWHKDKGPIVKKEEKKIETKKIENPEKTLEKKEIIKTPTKVFERPQYTKKEEIKPIKPELDLPSDDDFVSLKEIKSKLPDSSIDLKTDKTSAINQNFSNKKIVNEKSLSELRAVLKSFSKNKVEEVRKDDKITPENKPKEIPEDKLRQMLRTD